MMGAEDERVMHEGHYMEDGRVYILHCGNADFEGWGQEGRRL